eukprot:PITA_02939
MLKEFIGKFIIVYLDDILIFSKTREEHFQHVRSVLEKLQQNKLLINLKRYTFLQKELVYLGFMIVENVLKTDPEKIATIFNWPSPKSLFELPLGIRISPIFNVADQFTYTADPEEDSIAWPTRDTQDESKTWMRQMPFVQPLEIERILDTRVVKRTR